MKKYLTIMGLLGLAACGGAPSNIDGDHVFYAFDSAVITDEYNLALGALRAGNAAHVLIRNDIEPERIKTISYGKENPIYSGTGEKVWAKNRNATTRVHKVEE